MTVVNPTALSINNNGPMRHHWPAYIEPSVTVHRLKTRLGKLGPVRELHNTLVKKAHSQSQVHLALHHIPYKSLLREVMNTNTPWSQRFIVVVCFLEIKGSSIGIGEEREEDNRYSKKYLCFVS